MTPSRPYIVRALYEWITDNQCTPYILARVDDGSDVQVPSAYVKDGQIVLNVAPGAVAGLVIGNDQIVFSARFGGVAHQVRVPMRVLIGIYARENGQGMIFESAGDYASTGENPEPEPPSTGGDGPRPSLRVVK